MTLAELKDRVMFQTNNDSEDVGDYLPHLVDYLNDGYDRLVSVWAKQHVSPSSSDWLPLEDDLDEPLTPAWTHPFIGDWATWLVYRNGNPQKQQRGYAFREAFLGMLSKIADEGGMDGLNEDGTQKQYKYFRNIPR